MTNRIRVATAVGAVLLAVGCLYFYHLEQLETRKWAAVGLDRIHARTQNGEVSVTATSDTVITAVIKRRASGFGEADAENAIKDVVVTDSLHGNTLFLAAEMPDLLSARSYGAAYEISAPDSLHLDIATSNGAVTVTGINGGGELITSNGAVTLTNTTGPLVATTSNGAVTVANHQDNLEVYTSNGAIDCDLSRLPAGSAVTLNTSNGGVTLHLPSSAAVHLDARTSNGEVAVTGFSVSYTEDEPTHKVGTIGAGGADVTIITSNGAVTIKPR